ncbi:MAG: hypothetical protein QXR48_03895 [Candidatus Woesearchaeota archaeon]
MAEEGKGVALAILGIVAVIAVVGLVLLFTGATGKYTAYGMPKLYPGKVVKGETGQGFPYLGSGEYVAEQKGSCLSNEVFVQRGGPGGISIDPQMCRDGEMRVEIYHRNNKFFGAPDQTVVVEGWCCMMPSAVSPRMNE